MRVQYFIFIFLVPLLVKAQDSDSCIASLDFSAIQVYNGIHVELICDEVNKICCDKSKNFNELDISVEDNVITIRRALGSDKDKPAIIKVFYHNLKRIEAYNKSAIGTPNLMKGDSVQIILKTGATFYGSFDIKYLDANVTEGCLLSAEGYAVEQNVNVTLKASFSGFNLEGEKGNIKATSGGIAKVNISEELKAIASSGGYIGYKASPKIEKKASLGGKIVNDTD